MTTTPPRCRICGYEGPDLRPGLYRTSKGRYAKILRCIDHEACDERRRNL